MQIPKASDQDKECFRSLVPDDGPDVVVNAAAVRQPFRRAPSTARSVQGRAMGGYVGLPESWEGEPEKAAAWVARAHEYVSGLPPKAPKAPKAGRGPRTR